MFLHKLLLNIKQMHHCTINPIFKIKIKFKCESDNIKNIILK